MNLDLFLSPNTLHARRSACSKFASTETGQRLSYIHRMKFLCVTNSYKKVQVGKDQEKAQSEKDSHSKNQGGKKPN